MLDGTSPENQAAPHGERKPRACILLVDDHPDTLQILSRLFKKWCYEVETADSVSSALQLARTHSFDMLISDVTLPDGNGCEIMAEVRKLYGLRGIALSGFGSEQDLEASREAGFEEHFVKPVSFPVLRKALERLLNSTQLASEAGQN